MTTWYQRMLPYPLLAPWTDDYGNADFSVDVADAVLNNGRQIRVGIVSRLSSKTLMNLLTTQRARYAVEVSCPRTFIRATIGTAKEDTLVLDAGDYSEEILLTPYIVSTGPMERFISAEHASEWRSHKPDGFTVPAAGILAVGYTTRIILEDASVFSVIDLIANTSIAAGTFHVQLEDERIKIHVPPQDKEKIEAIRKRRSSGVGFASLVPGLYLHAVADALRNLSDHENTRWAFSLRNALHEVGYGDVDEELLRSDSLKYAQELMGRPIGSYLTVAVRPEEEE